VLDAFFAVMSRCRVSPLRARRIEEPRGTIDKKASGGATPMTMDEIEAEIHVYRQS